MNSNRTVTILGNAENIDLLENLYQQYQLDPTKLTASWRQYFESFESLDSARTAFASEIKSPLSLEVKIDRLIDAYRMGGHLFAKINPIALKDLPEPMQLNMQMLGFQPEELDQLFPTRGILPKEHASLRELIERLRTLYCGSIGFEYMDMEDPALEKWVEQQIESPSSHNELSTDQKKMILEYLNRSELFEAFLHMKYVGQKRFSLEGAESLIPMLGLLIEKGADSGLEEIILGMAHRGRLNVLSNILNKSYEAIFSEFDEGYVPASDEGTGDVKYHKGYTADTIVTHGGKKIKITLAPNPSHLESIDPVVEGQTRAKQTTQKDVERHKIIPILIHGDAALAGQGVVYETLQLCKLPGYTTGGTLHFVINNQIGFTTIPRDLRSTLYCTDIARAFKVPVFHVNAEDPESCVRVTLLALEIRKKFHCDVFIDLNCYRKYGHNESDEPAFTQPLEYGIIRKKKPIRELYRDQMIQLGMIEKKVIERMEEEFKQELQRVHAKVLENVKQRSHDGDFMQVSDQKLLFQPFPTGVAKERLIEVTKRFSIIPSSFKLHPKLENLVKERLHMVLEDKPIDWGMGEYLAYATLLWENVSIRISGQDCCRGTFSHRHAIWVDQTEEKDYFPLAHLKEEQGLFEIYNSPLSEMAVLGFEYGYSVVDLNGLTIWEAQFGDFSNGAQVIIDQYIVSGEQKWGQQSNLTLFLPHGYEGQGPEHSSGRLERFLTLAGHDNIQVINPTTPAQLFHLLRRQALRPLHKPLVVFTPKGLLRYPACVSPLKDLIEGSFQDILDDPLSSKNAKRVVLCSGRIYYDLIEQRAKEKRDDIAFIRIEQLYPLNEKLLRNTINQYSQVKEFIWAQEEHKNMGAWNYIRSYLDEILPKGIPLYYVGRFTSAAPATGSHSRHKQEYIKMINQVFQHET